VKIPIISGLCNNAVPLMYYRYTQPKNTRRITKKKKSRYNDLFLEAAVQPPPRQHQKYSFSKSDASKKETLHKHRRCPIIDHRFRSGESPRSQNNAFSKAIVRHNQLWPDIGFSPCKVGL
jgi:hypothetical protein